MLFEETSNDEPEPAPVSPEVTEQWASLFDSESEVEMDSEDEKLELCEVETTNLRALFDGHNTVSQGDAWPILFEATEVDEHDLAPLFVEQEIVEKTDLAALFTEYQGNDKWPLLFLCEIETNEDLHGLFQEHEVVEKSNLEALFAFDKEMWPLFFEKEWENNGVAGLFEESVIRENSDLVPLFQSVKMECDTESDCSDDVPQLVAMSENEPEREESLPELEVVNMEDSVGKFSYHSERAFGWSMVNEEQAAEVSSEGTLESVEMMEISDVRSEGDDSWEHPDEHDDWEHC